jgi:hypothetical protein
VEWTPGVPEKRSIAEPVAKANINSREPGKSKGSSRIKST